MNARIAYLESQRPSDSKGYPDGWSDKMRMTDDFRKNIGNPNTAPINPNYNPSDMIGYAPPSEIGKFMFPNPLAQIADDEQS